MKKVFIVLVFISSLFANEEDKVLVDNSFITKFEYGKMLYTNPRGIGCDSCHGIDAKGKKIVSFKHTYRKKTYDCELIIPSIRDVKYEDFKKKVNSTKNPKKKFEKDQVCQKLIYKATVMPTYFLVEEEVDAIYHYVKNLK